MNAVEYRFYQRIVDCVAGFDWSPETYYTLPYPYGDAEPSMQVSYDLIAALEPFIGQVMKPLTEAAMQLAVNDVLNVRAMNREILIWTDANMRPLVIDAAKVVRSGERGYTISPYLDRSDIMREVLEKLEQGN